MTQEPVARDTTAREATAAEASAREPLFELHDALAQYQLRDAGAEVAAAIAHAVGTPLNVISGRAELIRHDPANAIAQVARIEEQVKKLATGLRQLVDYLALPDPRTPPRPASVSKRTPADGTPAEARGAVPARASSPARPPEEPSLEAPGELVIVDARAVLEDVLARTLPLAGGVEIVVVDADTLNGARVDRWHALATLSSLVSCAVRHVASRVKKGSNGHAGPTRIRLGGAVASQGVVFELLVPGLPMVEGWQIEHFQARPAAADCSDFYRTLSISAAIVRGHGGRLVVENQPSTDSVVVRFTCRNESAS